jgi:glycosyltransferase involved in cell wall biosynthesis
MRILTVIYEFPPIGGGGGRAAYDICKGLAARGHAVTVLTSHISGLPYEEVRDGIHLVRVPSLREDHFVAPFKTMFAYVLSGLWIGMRLILKNRPDVMHTHFAVPSGALAWALSVLTGVPYVLTAHLGDVPGGVPEKTGKWFRWIKPFTYPIWKRAKRIAAVSEHTRNLALRHYNVDIEVIPNGADIKLLAPTEIKLNTPPRIVFAGRFAPQKNTLAIVSILARLQDLNWTCSMLGDGEYLERVKREIEEHSMSARFDLPGWVTPEDVLEKFSHSDILFMPSLSEGLPVVGVQALAKGLALVVSDIGGFLDLVDVGKNGFLIDVHDHARFESSLRDLLSKPGMLAQYRNASLQKAVNFDIAHIESRYEEIFQEVVLPRKTRPDL